MLDIPEDYEEFLRKIIEERKGLYEKLCKISEAFPIPPSKDLEEKYNEAIDFAHLNITPKGAFSFAILASIAFSIFALFFAFILGILVFDTSSISIVITIVVFDLVLFYYLYNYPLHLATVFRIKASSEMILAVVYMSIAMRVTPNLENAVKFAASNLTGPLAYDLKQMLWNLYTRKFDSISDAIDAFQTKWKRENVEFVEAIDLIQTSMVESTERRERILDESVSVMLSGTRERMNRYAHDLRAPITILNAMGILLPIIGLVFFPMLTIFLPEVAKPVFLIIGYNFILPITIFWMMKSSLEKRPYTFYQPDISKHPKFVHEKIFNKVLIISILISVPPIAFGSFMMGISGEVFSFDLLIYSLLVVAGIAGGISFYCIFSAIQKIKIREEVVKIEKEFSEALFQLGSHLVRGIPLEKTLKNITPRIKDLTISKFFEVILFNIESFGMTLEQAIFDKEFGAIKFYPSKTINAIMRALVEISKRGMVVASKAMMSVSDHLKNVSSVEEQLKDVLSEVTSTMNVQALILAPLTSGIVISLAAIMIHVMVGFKEMVENIQTSLGGAGAFGNIGGGLFSSLINVNEMVPVYIFQLIVGIYMLEVVGMLAIFMSIINNGDEDLMKRYTLGKIMLIATVIYIVVAVLVYSSFISMMPVFGMVE